MVHGSGEGFKLGRRGLVLLLHLATQGGIRRCLVRKLGFLASEGLPIDTAF